MAPEDLAVRVKELTHVVADLTAKLPDLILREEVERKERRLRLLVRAMLVVCVALVLVAGLGVVTAARVNNEGRKSRQALCDYLSRYGEAAKLDRQALIIFSTRPGAVITDEQRAVIDAYLGFGKEAYPKLDCKSVVNGDSPPALPPLPSRPTVD